MVASRALVFVAVAVLLLLGIPGTFHASTAGTIDESVTGETWTPNTTNWTVLDHSRISGADYSESVTVRDNNGKLVDEGEDYLWNSSIGEGTIKAVAGGDLDGVPSATIDYEYGAPSDNQLLVRDGFGMLFSALPYLLAAIFGGMFLLAAWRLF